MGTQAPDYYVNNNISGFKQILNFLSLPSPVVSDSMAQPRHHDRDGHHHRYSPTININAPNTNVIINAPPSADFRPKQKSWWPTYYAPATDAVAYYKTVTNVSGEEAARINVDRENIGRINIGSINIGPGAGSYNEGPFSGSSNKAKGNLSHMEQYVGTMARESIRGKSMYQQKEESVESCDGKMKKTSTKIKVVEDVIDCKVKEKESAWLDASAVGHVTLDYIPALHEIFFK